MNIKFTSFPSNDNWVRGTAGRYNFVAKLFDEPSWYGINDGRVSKLEIREEATDRRIVNYDRGWDIEPKTENEKKAFNAILEFLENSPRRFDD